MLFRSLDSNKFDKVLAWKRQTCFTEDITTSDEQSQIMVSEFGDLKATDIRKPQKKLTDEEIKSAIEDYRKGLTTYQLAEKYGCHRQTITRCLKKHDVDITKCKATKKLNQNTVVEMYANMFTSERIAKHFKVHPQAIIRCLRANDVKIRSRWDY